MDFPNVDRNDFLTYEQVFSENICVNCKYAGNKVFCDIENKSCLSRQKLAGNLNQYDESQCVIVSHPGIFPSEYLKNEACLFPGFDTNPKVTTLMEKVHRGWKEVLSKTKINTRPSLASLTQGKMTHFAIVGKQNLQMITHELYSISPRNISVRIPEK